MVDPTNITDADVSLLFFDDKETGGTRAFADRTYRYFHTELTNNRLASRAAQAAANARAAANPDDDNDSLEFFHDPPPGNQVAGLPGPVLHDQDVPPGFPHIQSPVTPHIPPTRHPHQPRYSDVVTDVGRGDHIAAALRRWQLHRDSAGTLEGSRGRPRD